jgi:hypothetical protein
MKVVIKTLFIAIVTVLLAVPAAAMDYAYELLAEKTVDGLSDLPIEPEMPNGPSKLGEVDTVVDALIAAAHKMPELQVAMGTGHVDRLTYSEFFPTNTGATPNNVGRTVEISFGLDSPLLAFTGQHHAIPFPLGVIGVLTQGDQVQVYASVPETRIRVFFRDLGSTSGLEALGQWYRKRIELLVENALEGQGFTTGINTGVSPELDDGTIEYIESSVAGMLEMLQVYGYTLTNYDHVAPGATLPNTTVHKVVKAFERAVDGDVTTPDVIGVGAMDLPAAFSAAGADDAYGDPADDVSQYEAINTLLTNAQSPSGVWHNGQALQEWILLRVLKITEPWAGNEHLIELCQPFFARAALGAPAFYHYLDLPCGLVVWQEGPDVQIALYNPLVVFSNFFSDAIGGICNPNTPAWAGMCNLFQVFPLVAFNEVASIVNGVLGVNIPLYPVPPLPVMP